MGGWGRGILNVTPSGKVLPCHAAETIPGLVFDNVRDRRLRDIWLTSEAFQSFPRHRPGCASPAAPASSARSTGAAAAARHFASPAMPRMTDPACAKSSRHAEFARHRAGRGLPAAAKFAFRKPRARRRNADVRAGSPSLSRMVSVAPSKNRRPLRQAKISQGDAHMQSVRFSRCKARRRVGLRRALRSNLRLRAAARNSRRRRRGSRAALQHGRLQARPARRADDGDAARQDPARQAQGAGRLQGRDLGARHARRAHDGPRRQGHGLRRHAHHRQGLRHHRQGRQARAQGDRRRPAAAQRRRLQGRHALRHHASTRCCASTASRTSSTRRSRPTSARQVQAAAVDASQLEVCGDRARQQDLFLVGAPCNVCEINPGMHGRSAARTSTARASRSWRAACATRSASIGTRQTKELWFTDNGRDWAGDDRPEDELNRVPEQQIGANFGFPYCHANGIPDPDIKKPEPVRRRDTACRLARPACGRARHALLHRQHVPGRVQEPCLHRPARLLEPHQEVRL